MELIFRHINGSSVLRGTFFEFIRKTARVKFSHSPNLSYYWHMEKEKFISTKKMGVWGLDPRDAEKLRVLYQRSRGSKLAHGKLS